jgi:hypothetical protein
MRRWFGRAPKEKGPTKEEPLKVDRAACAKRGHVPTEATSRKRMCTRCGYTWYVKEER